MNSVVKLAMDAFIERIASDSEAESFVFVRGFPARNIPNPIVKPLVAVIPAEVECTGFDEGENAPVSERYDIKLTLRVYAPTRSDDNCLFTAAAALMRAARRADEDELLRGMRLSETKVENPARTVYRDLVLSLRYTILNGDTVASDVEVTAGNTTVSGVSEVKYEPVYEGYEVMEMLSTSPVAVMGAARYWKLILTVYALSDDFEMPQEGVITVRYGRYEVIFSGCRLLDAHRHISESADEKNTYILRAGSMIRRECDE